MTKNKHLQELRICSKMYIEISAIFAILWNKNGNNLLLQNGMNCRNFTYVSKSKLRAYI